MREPDALLYPYVLPHLAPAVTARIYSLIGEVKWNHRSCNLLFTLQQLKFEPVLLECYLSVAKSLLLLYLSELDLPLNKPWQSTRGNVSTLSNLFNSRIMILIYLLLNVCNLGFEASCNKNLVNLLMCAYLSNQA